MSIPQSLGEGWVDGGDIDFTLHHLKTNIKTLANTRSKRCSEKIKEIKRKLSV